MFLTCLCLGFAAGSALALIWQPNLCVTYLRVYGIVFLALIIWIISAEGAMIVSQAGWIIPPLTFLGGIALALFHRHLLWRSLKSAMRQDGA